MRQTSSMVNWFTSGFRYAMEPGVEQDGSSCDERWYLSWQVGQDEHHDILRREIKEWLDDYCPGRYRVAQQGLSGPETTWLRPIYFKTRSDAMIFKMHWQGQTPTSRVWDDEPLY